MIKAIVSFVLVSFLAIVPAISASTLISDPHDPNNPNDELNLYEIINAMMGTTLTSSQDPALTSKEVTADEYWHEWDSYISIVATYAGYDQNLWWENSSYSGEIFYVSSDGLQFYDNPPITLQTEGGDFYFKDITSGGTWYSREDMNTDGKKHMITYSFGNGIFICAFEDLNGLGDQDYNDLVFKIVYGAAPVTVPAISYIPDQSVMAGYPFTDINLDNYIRDDDHGPSGITWTTSGGINISVSINPATRIANISYTHGWTGSETITFIATDPDGRFDSDEVTFTVNPLGAPIVSDIPDQTVKKGKPFTSIHLDDYVYHPYVNDEDIKWKTSGGVNISVIIDNNRVAHIIYPVGWTGSETITFIATVNPSSSNPATFTVLSTGYGGGSVGGIVVPTNKITLLTPWIILGTLITVILVISMAIVKKKRNDTSE
jgi:hypothetical protein